MSDEDLAGALAEAAVTIVRRLRAADRRPRLTGPQASALAVIIYAGRIRMSQLAQLEEVSRPAITKTVAQLEAMGVVSRTADAEDGRVLLVAATANGKRLFREGHRRRTAPLAEALAKLGGEDRETLRRAIALIDVLGTSIRSR